MQVATLASNVGTNETCVACGQTVLEPFLDLGIVPVETTSMYWTREEAVAAPAAQMSLHRCRRCGLVRNVAFDERLIGYSTEYENSQHFSPTFRAYAEGLADRLVATYGLEGATVADLGCGKGEFLTLLAERAGGHGIGFDPTYDGEVDDSSRIEIRREFFPGAATELDVRLVTCRHVLEHLREPGVFLTELRTSLAAGTPVYFEVPNAEHVLTSSGMWDLIYQHVSYFTRSSLAELFSHAGFSVTKIESTFEDQFLSLYAEATTSGSKEHGSGPSTSAVGFPSVANARMAFWEEVASSHRDSCVVVWGAGAKGASFLSLSAAGELVSAVIDINPRKHGAFVPGCGAKILPPGELPAIDPDLVIVANRVYRSEIEAELARMDVNPELLCL